VEHELEHETVKHFAWAPGHCFPPQGGRAVDWRRSLVRIHLTDEVLQPWEKRHWDSADPTSRAGGAPNFLPPAHLSPTTAAGRSRVQTMFIVKGKPRPPDGIMKVVKAARAEAFWAYSRRIAERPPGARADQIRTVD
jgi:hypothetical protein